MELWETRGGHIRGPRILFSRHIILFVFTYVIFMIIKVFTL